MSVNRGKYRKTVFRMFGKGIGIFLAGIAGILVLFIVTQLITQHVWVKNEQTSVKELTAEQKKADFRYLTKLAGNYYPFGRVNVKVKGLEDFKAVKEEYIVRAGKTKDNTEFIKLVNEYLQRIHQTGHEYVLSKEEAEVFNTFSYRALLKLKKEDFNKTEYWNNLLYQTTVGTYSDLAIQYNNGGYYLQKDYYLKDLFLQAGTQITRVNGQDTDGYVKSLQNKHWLRFDSFKEKVYISNPFLVDNEDGKTEWEVEFKLPGGKLVASPIVKRFGYKLDTRMDNNPYNSMFCRELNNTTGYIRVYYFPGDYHADYNIIQDFMKASGGRYNKLIIDIRGNNGGNTDYWKKVFVEPLMKEVTYDEREVSLSKKYFEDYKMELNIFKATGGGLFHKNSGFVSAKRIRFDNPYGRGMFTFKVTRVFYPKNTFPFDGKVFLLVDHDCFSAAEDFAGAVKDMKLATIVGSNTQGGMATLLNSVPFALPESGIMFAFETDMSYNQDGTVNEVYGTKPDVELETSTYPTAYPLSDKTEELRKDPWISWVMNYVN